MRGDGRPRIMDRHPAIRSEWELSEHFWAEGHHPPVPEPRAASSENFLRRCARRLHGRLNVTATADDDLDEYNHDLQPPIRRRSNRRGNVRLPLPSPSPPPPPLPPRRAVGDNVVGRRTSVVDDDDDDDDVAAAVVTIDDDDDDDDDCDDDDDDNDDVDNTTVTSTSPPPPLPPRRSIKRRGDDGETEMSETVEYREVSTRDGVDVDLDYSPTMAVYRV